MTKNTTMMTRMGSLHKSKRSKEVISSDYNSNRSTKEINTELNKIPRVLLHPKTNKQNEKRRINDSPSLFVHLTFRPIFVLKENFR